MSIILAAYQGIESIGLLVGPDTPLIFSASLLNLAMSCEELGLYRFTGIAQHVVSDN